MSPFHSNHGEEPDFIRGMYVVHPLQCTSRALREEAALIRAIQNWYHFPLENV